MRIGVVTVTYNSGAVLESFLRCCGGQVNADCRLLVVDNASSDSTRQIIGSARDIDTILNDSNVGFAAASNQGIRYFLERGAERIILINNDTEFPATLFFDLDRLMTAHGCPAITPRIAFFDRPESNWYAGGRFVMLRGFTGFHDNYRKAYVPEKDDVRQVEFAPACCLMIARGVFERIGLFDERFFVYWEDGDFCMRMKEAGIPVFLAPKLTVAHKASALTGGGTSDFTIVQYHRNQMYFVRKHFGVLVVAYTVVVMMIKCLLRFLLRGDSWRQLKLRVRATFEGLSDVRR